VRSRLLSRNPCDEIDPPSYRPTRRRLWTQDELRRFLEGSQNHPMHLLWLTAVMTGCRPGELLALTWADVREDLCALDVYKSVQVIDGREIVTSPKTPSGDRIVPIPKELMHLLLSTAPEGRRLSDRVFPFSRRQVERALKRECERQNLPQMQMHGFRHMHASLLLTRGLSVPEVSQRLGHATPAITMQVYAHVIGQSLRAVEIMQEVLL